MRGRVGGPLMVAMVCLGTLAGVRSGVSVRAQDAPSAADAALAAAARLLNASAAPDCATPNDAGVNCIRPAGGLMPANPDQGIAAFSFSAAEGGGASVYLGRTASGAWEYWFGSQQIIYQRLDLPGPMLVCAGGDGANVRLEPSTDAAILDALPDLTLVTADRFVLTVPGTVPSAADTGSSGEGWYAISAPISGWVYARLLSQPDVDAAIQQPPCWLRDVMNR